MPIINTLPNTIANGQLEDAVPVMANFNWILSQVNGNACPATSGSGLLKGNGSGGTITAVAGTDYAGITSVNTFTQLQSGIAAVADANFPIASQVQASAFNTGTTGGTADAITATFAPVFTALASAPVWWRATAANATTTPTFKRDGLVAKTLVKGANQALVAGDIPGAGAWMCSQYDATLDKEVLLNPAYAVSEPIPANIAGGAAGSVPYQSSANTTAMLAIGSTGQFLEVVAGLPAWVTAPVKTVAWVNFDGTLASPITPRAGYNIASVVKNGVGDYTINFTTPISDANYAASISVGNSGSANVSTIGGTTATPPTTSAFRFTVQNGNTGGVNDSPYIHVVFTR